jgi:hypothetical protein
MTASDTVHRLNEAIDAFEEAVKKHEHVSMLDSEVVLREKLDRARERLRTTALELINEAGR